MININEEDILQKLAAKAVELRKADPNAKLLINEHEAYLVTGIKVTSLRKRRWAGNEPRFYKIGSKIRYNYFDLQDFLESCLCKHATKEVKINIEESLNKIRKKAFSMQSS